LGAVFFEELHLINIGGEITAENVTDRRTGIGQVHSRVRVVGSDGGFCFTVVSGEHRPGLNGEVSSAFGWLALNTYLSLHRHNQ
jgi:hypothetical protein